MVGSFFADAAQLLEEDFLRDAFDLDEDVVQHDLGHVPLEIVLLGSMVVGAQDVNLCVLAQPLQSIRMGHVHFAQVVEAEITQGLPFEVFLV